MNDALFGTIAITGLAVAFLHAALPTHWLPFVLAGRRQGWSRGKTLTVTTVAGGGHVLFTVALGVLVAWLGIAVDRWTGSVFPYIAASVLIAFGLYYGLRDGHGPHEHHHAHGHDHDDAETHRGASDRAVVLGLLAALTFSPCEGFLPVFVAGVKFGWAGFFGLCLVLAVATLAGMLLLTWLTLLGLEQARFEKLEHYEGRIAGGLLIALGLAVLILET